MIVSTIISVTGREILDSRGNPTIECDVVLKSGSVGRASIPSGASVGKYEAVELRDNEMDRYFGKGVLKSVENINTEIAQTIVGFDARHQTFIDYTLIELDGTENKSRLGANSILAVSLATARAVANELGLSLYRYLGGIDPVKMPVPMMNILNGGVHANNNLNFQEFMIIPIGANSFREALRWGAEIFHTLKKIFHDQGIPTTVGDEGGFAPNINNHEKAIQLILQAVIEAGYEPGSQVVLGLDCASSEFYHNGKYILSGENGLILSSQEFSNFLEKLCEKYPIISIEDGMSENDLEGWKLITKKLGRKVQLVGDDLFVTNTKILKEGIKNGIANSILIKINQIGTLTETFAAIEMAKCSGYTSIISHRSGETEDSIIADIAVGKNVMQIKTGSLSRSDRIAKYNQLLRIEQELLGTTIYPGIDAFFNLF